MAQHDGVISNASGAAVRADLNNALAALITNSSGATSPGTTYAYQWWADTTTGQLKLRNSANNAWITIFELDGTMLMEDGTVSAPGLAFASDLNTGFFRSAADKINFATGGAERLEIGSSEVVFNDPSNDVDFRVESNGNTHMLFVDAGNDRVGIGAASPSNAKLEITNSTNGDEAIRLSDTRATPSANKRTVDIRYTGTNGRTASNTQLLYLYDNNSSSTQPFMEVENASSSLFVIDSSGQVGIGASSSLSAALTVVANTNAEAINVRGRSSDDVGEINFWSNDESTRYAKISARSSYVELRGPDAGSIRFNAFDGTEFTRIDSSGRLLVGHSSSRSVDAQMVVQIEGTTQQGSSMSLVRNSNDAAPPNIVFGKSRGTSLGSNTVVQSGDDLGIISFFGADGTDTNSSAASIKAEVDGTPGSNDMPGRLVFSTTADGASSATERVTIDSSGNVGIGTGTIEANTNYNTLEIVGDTSSGGGVIRLKTGDRSTGKTMLFCDTGGFEARVETNHPAIFSTNNTERMRILAGGGLTFNGDTAAANALDDYEEGTFTPSYIPETGSFTAVTYAEQFGAYTKIGNRVWFNLRIRTSGLTKGSASNAVYINGLPFNAVSDSSYSRNAISLSRADNWTTNFPISGYVENGENYIVLFYRSSANSAVIASGVNDMTTGTNKNQLWISGSYPVSI